jgi:hypothetical protein
VMLMTRFLLSSITICTLFAASDKQFHAAAADSYAHQKSDDVTVGARIYDKPEQIEEAFGKKIDFAHYGITPVLVVIQNDRKHTVDLRSMEVSIVGADGGHASAMKPEDVQLMAHNGKHPSQVPLNVPIPKRKASITRPEVEARAFVTEMLAPGDSASGFFYFNGKTEPGDKLYINGLQEAPSGTEITFFEFPFEP